MSGAFAALDKQVWDDNADAQPHLCVVPYFNRWHSGCTQIIIRRLATSTCIDTLLFMTLMQPVLPHVSTPTPLTWQQELLTQTWKPNRKSEKPKSATGSNPARGKRKDKLPSASSNVAAPSSAMTASGTTPPTPSSSGLTWQQELFQQSKRPGPTYDRAETAKDMETFGTQGSKLSKPTNTKVSADRNKSKNASKGKNKNLTKLRDSQTPMTPSKIPISTKVSSSSSPLSAPLAYAGPEFHNSPSAASLPTPRFTQSRGVASATQLTPQTPPQRSETRRETVDHLLSQILASTSLPSTQK